MNRDWTCPTQPHVFNGSTVCVVCGRDVSDPSSPERRGVYLQQDPARIAATLALLRYFQRFLASGAREAHDPVAGWGHYMTQPQARHKLTWLINVAINRKAGLADRRGRKQDPDYQRALGHDARLANTPRVRITRFNTPELNRRLAHRLSGPEDF